MSHVKDQKEKRALALCRVAVGQIGEDDAEQARFEALSSVQQIIQMSSEDRDALSGQAVRYLKRAVLQLRTAFSDQAVSNIRQAAIIFSRRQEAKEKRQRIRRKLGKE